MSLSRKAIVIPCLLLASVQLSCVSARAKAASCRLVFESLWNEALEETVVVGRGEVAFFQYEDKGEERALTAEQYSAVRPAMGVLQAWARRTPEDRRGWNGEFLTVSCDGSPARRLNLASAGGEVWQALEKVDELVAGLFPDYTPIKKNARSALGY